MKKILALMIIVLVVFTLGGCKKSETQKSNSASENTELDNDLGNLDKTDQELNTSGLDNLDQDLNKVNW